MGRRRRHRQRPWQRKSIGPAVSGKSDTDAPIPVTPSQSIPNLNNMLIQSTAKEVISWKALVFPVVRNETEVSGLQRDVAVKWLASLTREFQFTPETFALSVTILDTFLVTVKARPKYLKCIAISCFYIASKMKEEDEMIPSGASLISRSNSSFTVSELYRMEKLVLDKLNWDVNLVTALDFLHILHAMSLAKCLGHIDMPASRQLALLTLKLEACLTVHHFIAFKPSCLALTIFSLELELLVPRDWLPATLQLQSTLNVDSVSFIRCRELASRHLSTNVTFHRLYENCMARARHQTASAKRKVAAVNVDEIYVSIKRLFDSPSSTLTRTTE